MASTIEQKPDYYTTTIATVFTSLKDKITDLNVPYQRNVIWDEDKKKYLIDSLIKNMAINPVIFNLLDGKQRCVDGKQRLTAIYEFMTNKLYLEEDQDDKKIHVYYNEKPKNDDNVRIFTGKEKLTFDNNKIHVTSYNDLSYEMELEIFNRIQNGVPLTDGEKMKGLSIDIDKFFNSMLEEHKECLEKHITKKVNEEKRFFLGRLFYSYVTNPSKSVSKCIDILNELSKHKGTKLKDETEKLQNILETYFDILQSEKFKKFSNIKLFAVFMYVKELFSDDTELPKTKQLIDVVKEGLTASIPTICTDKNVAKVCQNIKNAHDKLIKIKVKDGKQKIKVI